MKTQSFAPPVAGLVPYAGTWTYQQAAHLLRRATFGPSHAQIQWAVDQGLAATLDKLFEELPLPAPPVNAYFEDDPDVPVGTTWINAPFSPALFSEQVRYRYRSVKSWTFGQILQEGIHIREKMTLFWHNHLPVNEVEDTKYMYRYGNTLRSFALGNFRDLVKAITIDPAMLRYLNGSQNKKGSPNENYARELLELFTIGKGPLAGPGDYTHYNEQDIQEIARILTGWRDFGLNLESTDGAFGSEFVPARHDTGVKTLSFHFDNAVINDMGDQEYAHLIDIIFQQAETARFICRKLYRWFVFYEIDEEVEANVIEPMAQVLLDNDFEIVPAVRALLESEHFYDPAYTGVLVKNPVDFLMSYLKPLDIGISDVLDEQYDSWYRINGFSTAMKMSYFEVPEVAGWEAYFREPLWNRNWLNASTIPIYLEHAEQFLTGGYFPFQANGPIMRIEVLKILDMVSNPTDPNDLIEEMVRLLFPKPISEARKAALKEILLPGLPDFEWTVECGEYLADPGNNGLANAVDAKLRNLVRAMVSMPNFFLH